MYLTFKLMYAFKFKLYLLNITNQLKIIHKSYTIHAQKVNLRSHLRDGSNSHYKLTNYDFCLNKLLIT